MHERRLMEDIMTKVLDVCALEGGERVTAVEVRLGALSHFTPEHFAEHFEDAARGTHAAGARVYATIDPDPTNLYARDVVLERVEIEGEE